MLLLLHVSIIIEIGSIKDMIDLEKMDDKKKTDDTLGFLKIKLVLSRCLHCRTFGPFSLNDRGIPSFFRTFVRSPCFK